jgi:hypothetical protein
MVDGVHHGDQHRGHGGGKPSRCRSQTVDEPEREGDEAVGDFLWGDLVRAQPDDRQDAEQAQAKPDTGLGALSRVVTASTPIFRATYASSRSRRW